MALDPFEPQNALERIFTDARDGVRTMDDALSALSASPVFVSSRKEVMVDGSGFEPLLLEHNDAPLIAVFTDGSRAVKFRDRAEYLLQMGGRDLIVRTPPGYGLIVNPGYQAQLIVEPGALAGLRDAARVP